VQANKWHSLKVDALFGKVETFDGGDGGLVCCVLESMWRNNKPKFFIVMNPLMKQRTQLLPLFNIGTSIILWF